MLNVNIFTTPFFFLCTLELDICDNADEWTRLSHIAPSAHFWEAFLGHFQGCIKYDYRGLSPHGLHFCASGHIWLPAHSPFKILYPSLLPTWLFCQLYSVL